MILSLRVEKVQGVEGFVGAPHLRFLQMPRPLNDGLSIRKKRECAAPTCPARRGRYKILDLKNHGVYNLKDYV
jgi:hypothetical protein